MITRGEAEWGQVIEQGKGRINGEGKGLDLAW